MAADVLAEWDAAKWTVFKPARRRNVLRTKQESAQQADSKLMNMVFCII
jgi:hypothetical protein